MPRFDPTLGRDVPTDSERLISAEAEEIRRELRVSRGQASDGLLVIHSWLRGSNSSLSAILVMLVAITILLAAIAIRLWLPS